MKKIISILLTAVAAILLVCMLAACNTETEGRKSDYETGYTATPGGAGSVIPNRYTEDGAVGEKTGYAGERTASGDAAKGDEGAETGETGDIEEPEEPVQRQAGLITASAWDDNRYYEAWQALFSSGQTEEDSGKFVHFVTDNWGLDTTKRVKVTVTNGDKGVAGATVTYAAANQQTLTAKTDANGVAYLFTKDAAGTVNVASGEHTAKGTFTEESRDVAVTLDGAEAKKDVVKLMFVLDVTGSMDDELAYLQTELADVIRRVVNDTNTRVDLAFLFYRDDGDDEKMAFVEFKSVNDAKNLNAQLAYLNGQQASGGGDIPEAVDEALEMAIAADWGTENATRLIFHVLDAPAHSEKAHQTRFATAVKAAAAKGIRICPIMCSGADLLCEYLVRQEAIYTGGTFIFVTDDSGIGYGHRDPDLPNAVVEKLNDMLVRLISGYHTGVFAEPVSWKSQQ